MYKMTVLDEENLVKSLKDPGTREDSYRLLVSTYSRRLYWHIRKIVIDHDDADDVLQNTFIKVFRNMDGFRGDSKLYSWMYRIATNEAVNLLKQKAGKLRVDLYDYQQQLVDNLEADAYFDGDAIQLKLQKAIVSLPEKQQLVFRLKYYENMKYEEMSEILDTSVGSLKASYYHARKKIESFMQND